MFFVDMDGVLADWTKQYKKFNVPHVDFKKLPHDYHIFKELDPYEKIVEVVRILSQEYHIPVCVLTSIIHPEEFDFDLVEDKKWWLAKYVPFIDTKTQFLCVMARDHGDCGDKKATAAEKYIGRKINKKDVLLDDVLENVQQWQESGGTAIQNVNGGGHQVVIETDCLDRVYYNQSVDEIVKMILTKIK